MPRYLLVSYRCGHQEATRLLEPRRPNSPDKPFSFDALAPNDIAEQTYSRDECPNHSTKVPATDEETSSSDRVVFSTQWRKDFERLHNQLQSLHKRYVDFRSEAVSVGGHVSIRQPCHDVLLDLKLAKKSQSKAIIDRFDDFHKILDEDFKNVTTTEQFKSIFDKISDDLVAMKQNVDLLERQVDRVSEDVQKAVLEHSARTVRQKQQEQDQQQHQEEQQMRMRQVELKRMVHALASDQTFVPANAAPPVPTLEFDISLDTTTAAACTALEKTNPEMFAMLVDPQRQWVSAVGAFGGLIQVNPFNPGRPFGKIIPVVLDPPIQATPIQTNPTKNNDTSAKVDKENTEKANTGSGKKSIWKPSVVKKNFIKPNWEHELEEVIEESGVMSGVGTEDIVEKVMDLLFRTDVNIWGWSVCVEKLGPVDHDEEYKHPSPLTLEQAKLKEKIREVIAKKERQDKSQQDAESKRQQRLANSKNLRLPKGAKVTPFQYAPKDDTGENGFFEPNAPDKDRGFGERVEMWRYGDDKPKPKTFAGNPSTSAATKPSSSATGTTKPLSSAVAITKPSTSATTTTTKSSTSAAVAITKPPNSAAAGTSTSATDAAKSSTSTDAAKSSTSSAKSSKKGKNRTHGTVKNDTKTDDKQVDEKKEVVKDDALVDDKAVVDEKKETVSKASETSKVDEDSVKPESEPSTSAVNSSNNEEKKDGDDADKDDVKTDDKISDAEKKEAVVEGVSETSKDEKP